MKVDYTVLGCPVHVEIASGDVFLPKTSRGSNPELARKAEESQVIRE